MLKPTADMDKDALRWSFSWHPDGCCDSFTKEAILIYAPPASGVYGLFNFDCQIFIGEAANIQEALLRHESETDFQSRHLRPTGFTFKTCAADLRKPKANELIAKFHPVLQNEAGLSESRLASIGPKLSGVGLSRPQFGTYADHRKFSLDERDKRRPKDRRRFYFTRARGASLTAMLLASAAVIFYLGMPAAKNIQEPANGAGDKPRARIPITDILASGWARIGLGPQSASSTETAGDLAGQSAEPAPAEPDVHASAPTPSVAGRIVAQSASAADRAGIQAKTSPMARSADNANSTKKWSVQISAAPAKDIADTLAQRLKASGYDGYVVAAEVKGQTYYRVRVGPFEARDEAESVRQSLARQEGYRESYLTGD